MTKPAPAVGSLVDSPPAPSISLAQQRAEAEIAVPWRAHWIRSFRNGLPLLVTDVAGVLASLWLAAFLSSWAFSEGFSWAHPLYLIPVQIASISLMGLYPGIGLGPVIELRKLGLTSTLLALAITGTMLLASQFSWATIPFVALLWLFLIILLPLGRGTARTLLARTNWWGEPVLIFGGGHSVHQVYRCLQGQATQGLRPLGIFGDPHTHWEEKSGSHEGPYLGPLEEAMAVASRRRIAWAIVVEREGEHLADHDRWLQHVAHIPNRLFVGPTGLPSLWTESRECAGTAAFHVGERLLMSGPRLTKRAMDLVLCLLGGLALSPLFLLLATMVKLSSKGPVFFIQTRVGQEGRTFRMWKFRTMVVEAEERLQEHLQSDERSRQEWESGFKLKKDPRVVPVVGRFLRQTSLDELPQIWNVLRGDMSLVGPRPLPEYHLSAFDDDFSEMRGQVRPGMTGQWQVSERSDGDLSAIPRLDTYYIRNWSPWLDLYLLAQTVKAVLVGRGAY